MGMPAVYKPLEQRGTGRGRRRRFRSRARARRSRRSGGIRRSPATSPRRRAASPGAVVAAPVAALDLGTNNCRLLVARPAGGGFRVIDAFSRIVRLGEGLAATGALSEAAMARTLDALKVCADKIAFRRVADGRYRRHRSLPPRRQLRRVPRPRARRNRHRASRSSRPRRRRAWSSPAARRCSTRALPTRRLRHRRRLDRDRLAAARRAGASGAGGARRSWARSRCRSGVVTLTDRFGGEVSPAIYARWSTRPPARCRPFERSHRIRRQSHAGRVQMLGSSGTVTTLAGIHLALPRYIRALVDGSSLTFDRSPRSRRISPGSTSPAARPALASAASAPIWCSPAARFSTRSAKPGRSAGCASPIAACARASCST